MHAVDTHLSARCDAASVSGPPLDDHCAAEDRVARRPRPPGAPIEQHPKISGDDVAQTRRLHGSTRPSKILIVIPSLASGGAERVAVNLANGLLAAGASPSILLTDREGPLRGRLDPAVPVTKLLHTRVRAALPAVIRHIRRQTPDVVLTTHTHVSLAICASRRLIPRATRIAVRIPTHAPDSFEGRSTAWTRRAQRALYRSADLVLATSPEMARDLRAFLTSRIAVLPNPVDETAIRTQATAIRHPTSTGRRFVMVGQLRAAKAVDDLIRAFASGTDLSDRLTIVGEGPERPALKRLIAEHDLTGRVELMGAQPDPWDVVAGADAFVLASRHEGMPNVVLEALALGTPVIATDDLTSLTTLATESPDGAVTIVARSDLGRAIREVRPILEGTVIPRASLLPQAHTLAAATERLLSLLETS